MPFAEQDPGTISGVSSKPKIVSVGPPPRGLTVNSGERYLRALTSTEVAWRGLWVKTTEARPVPAVPAGWAPGDPIPPGLLPE